MGTEKTPDAGGGLPVIKYWAEKTLSSNGVGIWQKLLHKSACLSCAWGTGGQKGGFVNEDDEALQRCAKSVEANDSRRASFASELQQAATFESEYSLSQLQQLNSQDANNLGRFSHPLILRVGKSHYEQISWDEVYQLAEIAFAKAPERIASYSSGRSSNEAAYLLQLMMRSHGSNNLADCSDLCHGRFSLSPHLQGLGV
jgi:anaerobic selenocysteine-containing dehydrogenase